MANLAVQIIFPDNTAILVDNEIYLGRENFHGLVTEEQLDLISRKQLRIFREGHIFFVEDGYLNRPSVNSTKLNEQDIRGKGKQPLRSRDKIKIADAIELTIKIE